MSTATKTANRAAASAAPAIQPRADFVGATDYLTALDDMGGAGNVTLTGVPVARTAGLFDIKGCIPILGCLCVHDSPESPCPCKGPIFWIPEKDILFKQATRRQATVGRAEQSLLEIQLHPMTKLFVDTTSKAGKGSSFRQAVATRNDGGELQPVSGDVYVQRVSRVPAGALGAALDLIKSNDQVGAIAKEGGALDALIKAFGVGWAIGGGLNEIFDLPDKISDWMIDTFGPWPF
jgi:hypothetical protein